MFDNSAKVYRVYDTCARPITHAAEKRTYLSPNGAAMKLSGSEAVSGCTRSNSIEQWHLTVPQWGSEGLVFVRERPHIHTHGIKGLNFKPTVQLKSQALAAHSINAGCGSSHSCDAVSSSLKFVR